MVDIFSKKKRSKIMSRIRSRDTKIELAVKPIFEMAGFGYHPEGIAGSPDFAHLGAKIAVFIDGCFWHGCVKHLRLPKTNLQFWADKINRNTSRDRRTNRELRKRGWLVVRVWECDVPKESRRRSLSVKT